MSSENRKKLLNTIKYIKNIDSTRFYIMLFLVGLYSIFELLTLSAIHLFSTVIFENGPDSSSFYPDWIYNKNNFDTISLIVLMFILASGVYRYKYISILMNYVYNVGNLVNERVYKLNINTYGKIRDKIDHNSLKSILGVKIDNFTGQFLAPFFNIVQSITSILLISTLLMFYDPLIFFSVSIIMGSCSVFLWHKSKGKIRDYSARFVVGRNKMVQLINDSGDNSISILVNGYHDVFTKKFQIQNDELRYLQKESQIVSLTPKFIVETLVFLLLISGVYLQSKIGRADFISTMPILIAFVFAAQKLLPSINLLYFSLTQLQANTGVVQEIFGVLKILESRPAMSSLSKLENIKNIKINNLDWPRGQNSSKELLNCSLSAGSNYRLSGKSGSGKSSLIRAILKIYPQIAGQIFINGQPIEKFSAFEIWKHTTYISQSDVVFEDTVLNNVTMTSAVTSCQTDKVEKIFDLLGISEILANNGMDLNTIIGPYLNNLSGGQKQRIVMARCLYNAKSVIIFDEATSAMDEETESTLMKAIFENFNHNRIILFISHNPNLSDQSTMEISIS